MSTDTPFDRAEMARKQYHQADEAIEDYRKSGFLGDEPHEAEAIALYRSEIERLSQWQNEYNDTITVERKDEIAYQNAIRPSLRHYELPGMP